MCCGGRKVHVMYEGREERDMRVTAMIPNDE